MLSIRHLTRPGLSPVDLEMEAGECVVLSGPSGAGKSLFMRAIADLDPNQGEVFLDRIDRDRVPAPQWRRMVAYVPSDSGWWADGVADHFADPETAVPLLRRLGLDPAALDWPVSRLSTGERQRLALARALALEPKILLLDEPTSGLDPDAIERVESIIAERLAQGSAALFVTHDARQGERMGGRHLTMSAGVISAVISAVISGGGP